MTPVAALLALSPLFAGAAVVVVIAAIAHLAGVIAELSDEVAALRRHGLAARVRHRLVALGGGSRANMSRALARLERDGWIERHRGRIVLGARC